MQLMQLISELPVTSIVAIHDLNHAAMFCDSPIVMQQRADPRQRDAGGDFVRSAAV